MWPLAGRRKSRASSSEAVSRVRRPRQRLDDVAAQQLRPVGVEELGRREDVAPGDFVAERDHHADDALALETDVVPFEAPLDFAREIVHRRSDRRETCRSAGTTASERPGDHLRESARRRERWGGCSTVTVADAASDEAPSFTAHGSPHLATGPARRRLLRARWDGPSFRRPRIARSRRSSARARRKRHRAAAARAPTGTMRSLPMMRSCLPPETTSPARRSSGRLPRLTRTS